MLSRIFCRESSVESSNNLSHWPDPMDKLPHPANEEFCRYLVGNWQSVGLPRHRLETVSPSRDLVELFDNLVEQLDDDAGITKDTVYGLRVAATAYHLVFAWAQGSRDIFVKLRPEHHKEAVEMGGRLDATYPANWVEFLAGGARMPVTLRSQWRKVIRHWMRVSYNDSLEGRPALQAHLLNPPPPKEIPPEVEQTAKKNKDAFRITLTLSVRSKQLGSLDPLCALLVGRAWLETAKNHRDRSHQPVSVVSEKAEICFPRKENPWRFSRWGYVIGLAIGFAVFGFGWVPLLCGPAGGLLSGLVGILVDGIRSVEVTVRGALPDVMAASEDLRTWLSVENGRRVRLDVWDDGHLEAEARKPEDAQAMFEAAIAFKARKGSENVGPASD